MNGKLLMTLALGVLFTMMCASPVQAQEVIGYVLDLDGDWQLAKGSALKKGSALPSEGVINAGSAENISHFIIIADRNGRIIENRHCRVRGECDRPIRLPKLEQNQPSMATRIVDAVMALWATSPAKYRTFGVRGESASSREAVVMIADGVINLARPFATIKQGEYLIRFVDPGDQHIVLGPVQVRIGPGAPPSVPANSLVPGLYELQLLDKYSGEPLTIGTESWILVSRSAEYESFSSSFNQAAEMTKGWTNVDKRTSSSFLRAYLAHLALDVKK